MPIKSQAQRKFIHANFTKAEAAKWEKETPKKKLPEKVKSKKK